jgi:hypothetical protein
VPERWTRKRRLLRLPPDATVNPRGVDDERAGRFAKNEALFRSVNDRLGEISAAFDLAGEGATEFVCECADVECNERLRVAFDTYARVRESPIRFIVAPGHEIPDVEVVVERHDGFHVVEKTAAEQVAAEHG